MADGHLGIWAALGELHRAGDEQRCWNHKIVNVLNALPKKEQPEAGERLSAMMYAGSRSACERKRIVSIVLFFSYLNPTFGYFKTAAILLVAGVLVDASVKRWENYRNRDGMAR